MESLAHDENSTALPVTKDAAAVSRPSPVRQALGVVSPNVRSNAPTTGLLDKKATTGSPLKRSFTAAMEGGHGFTYLKRRRISHTQALSETFRPSERAASVHSAHEASEQDSSDGALRFNGQDLPTAIALSPTEPNTPSESDEESRSSSAERRSFSSLINYDQSSQNCASSQGHQSIHDIAQPPSRAEILRLRLQVAMYKVRTDQIHVPFTHLREDTSEGWRESNKAVEEAVAQLRREAREVLASAQKSIPKLQPGPILKPTAYSSRMIYDIRPPTSPVSNGSAPFAAPTQGSFTPQSKLRRYLPPSSPQALLEAELTSSAVKGRVAEGLLGLRHAL